MLTSSFPSEPDDETCGYIRDFARSLSSDFRLKVLTLPDSRAIAWPQDDFLLARSKSFLPQSLDPLQASHDLNLLLDRQRVTLKGLLVKLAAAISACLFMLKAFKLARKADVICSHWLLPSGFVGALVSRILGKPHIAVEHSGALHLLARMRCGSRLARFIVSNSYRIITVSSDLREKLISLCPEAEAKIEVMPMGTFAHRSSEPKASPSSGIALFLGRLVEIKGVEVLIRAAREVAGIRLLIAGDGPQKEALEQLARQLSVDARFLGRVGADEKSRLLSACDVVVIPSLVLRGGRTEGTPVVCLEAMAAGRVVIASRAGGLSELIAHGYNGLLFTPGNHQMLAGLLKLVLSDARLREKLSANARQTAAKYDWSLLGSQYAEVIKSSLAVS
jgi:glycosyltransferase involved in cell wall biosynthesis